MDSSPHLWFLQAKHRLLEQNYKSYGPQTSPVIFFMQTACLESELLVSMGPLPYLWFCAFKTGTLGPDIQVCMDPRPHLCL